MSKNKHLLVLFAVLILNTACVVAAVCMGEANVFRIVGSYVAFLTVAVLSVKLPLSVGVSAHIFVFLASSLGSVLGLYATIDVYDRIVHYLSGIMLGFAGFYICKYIFEVKNITESKNFAKELFAFLFSSACAGFWEIYEFTVDNLLGMQSQGDNFNTMGDIVAGVLGALTYIILRVVIKKLNKTPKA